MTANVTRTAGEKIRAFYALFWKPSREVLEEVLHEEITIDDSQLGVHLAGRDTVWGVLEFGTNRDHPIEVIAYYGDEDAGAAHIRLRWKAKHVGPAWGLPGTDEEIQWEAVELFRFRDGKIVSHRGFWDSGDLFRRLGGALPTPDPSKFGAAEGSAETP